MIIGGEYIFVLYFLTVKQQLVGRYVGFFRALLKSKSPEVQIVASMVGRNARSTTGSNLINIQRETGHDPWVEDPMFSEQGRGATAGCLQSSVPEEVDHCQAGEEVSSIRDR